MVLVAVCTFFSHHCGMQEIFTFGMWDPLYLFICNWWRHARTWWCVDPSWLKLLWPLGSHSLTGGLKLAWVGNTRSWNWTTVSTYFTFFFPVKVHTVLHIRLYQLTFPQTVHFSHVTYSTFMFIGFMMLAIVTCVTRYLIVGFWFFFRFMYLLFIFDYPGSLLLCRLSLNLTAVGLFFLLCTGFSLWWLALL